MMLVVLSQVLITVRMNTASFTFIKIILTSSLFSLLLLEEVVQMTLVPQVNCPPERKIHSAQHKKRNNKQTTFRSAQKRKNKQTTLRSAQKRNNKQTTKEPLHLSQRRAPCIAGRAEGAHPNLRVFLFVDVGYFHINWHVLPILSFGVIPHSH